MKPPPMNPNYLHDYEVCVNSRHSGLLMEQPGDGSITTTSPMKFLKSGNGHAIDGGMIIGGESNMDMTWDHQGCCETAERLVTLTVFPREGYEGSWVTAVISRNLLPPLNGKKLFMGFGNVLAETRPHCSSMTHISMIAKTPGFQQTNWLLNRVPLHVFVFEGGLIEDSIYLGEFIYNETGKRRSSEPVNSLPPHTLKRSSSNYSTSGSLPSSNGLDMSPIHSANHFDFVPMETSLRRHTLTSVPMSSTTTTTALVSTMMTTMTPTYSMNSEDNTLAHDLCGPASSLFRGSSSGSHSQVEMRAMLTTSSCGIPTLSGPNSSLQPSSPIGTFGPSMNIRFAGDLDSITRNWTVAEKVAGRKLVQFWKTKESNDIVCGFRAIDQSEVRQGSIIISCIYWASREGYFVTSVDAIFLLEQLVAQRFNIEEKNRIRRNLEEFRPLTVSRTRAESIEFFRLIMSFPSPKPRNIEKDVKVFSWRALPAACQKIIGKYVSSNSPGGGENIIREH
jgi:hypothetical protein